jgi:hypothetical protein
VKELLTEINIFDWQMKEENLDSTIDSFIEKREDYVIREGFYKWIKYCCVGKVPEQIKGKARRLVASIFVHVPGLYF